MDCSYISKNTAEIKEKIENAKKLSQFGQDIKLLSAIKYADIEEVKYLHYNCGINSVGENRVQQLLSRYDALKEMGLDIHFIGSLQTNKVKYVIDKVSLIHSLDRIELAKAIDKEAKKIGKVQDVLIEINSGEEVSKGGVLPNEAENFAMEISQLKNVNLRGFMTMAPKCEKKEEYLKYFSKTYNLVLDIWQKKLHNIGEPIISMGMSDSFEEAVISGANLVRVGRYFFKK